MNKLIMQPEFTNHCNFKCILCPHSYYKKETSGNPFNRNKGYMNKELFNLFLENANKYAVRVLIGFMGEPLLHPMFNSFIKAFPSKRDYTLHLFTNWSLMTRKNIEALKMCDSVRISLDASYPELWDKLCPGYPVLDIEGNICSNRYNTITTKLDYWLGLPDHSPTQLIYVVSSLNKHDKENFVKKWTPKIKGSDQILTKSFLSYGGIVTDEGGSVIDNPCNIVDGKRFTVAWNGDCTPCNLDVNIALNTGNLFVDVDVEKIIQSYKYKQVMETIKNREGICINCFDANNWTKHEIYESLL